LLAKSSWDHSAKREGFMNYLKPARVRKILAIKDIHGKGCITDDQSETCVL
jgi:hypothetical protein